MKLSVASHWRSSKMSKGNIEDSRAPRSGYIIHDDGTIVVFLTGGDVVFKFPDGNEEVRFADGISVAWDSNAILS